MGKEEKKVACFVLPFWLIFSPFLDGRGGENQLRLPKILVCTPFKIDLLLGIDPLLEKVVGALLYLRKKLPL